MKVLAVAAFFILGMVQQAVSNVHVAGGSGERLDFTILIAYAPLALVAIIVFAYAAWRVETERKWRRSR